MNNLTYGVVEECYTIGEEERISYGMVVYADFAMNGPACVVASVCDITSDLKKLLHLVQVCNQLQLSTIHINDVIEDFFLS